MLKAWLALTFLIQSSPLADGDVHQLARQLHVSRLDSLKVNGISLYFGSRKYSVGGLVFFVSDGKVIDTTGYCPDCPSPIKLIDLDGDGAREIVIMDYTYGAHCCVSYEFYRPLRHGVKFIGGIFTGNGILEFKDMDGDSVPEIVLWNDDFAYFEAPYAASPWYFNILKLQNDRFVDVTSQFKTAVLKDIDEIVSRMSSRRLNRPLTTCIVEIYARYHLIGQDRAGIKLIRRKAPKMFPWFAQHRRYIESTVDSSLSKRIFYAREARPF